MCANGLSCFVCSCETQKGDVVVIRAAWSVLTYCVTGVAGKAH